jgi:hypothetical protein
MPMAPLPLQHRQRTRGPITEADAVDIWIARWLRIRRRDLCIRYDCDPRRLYEIWEGVKFPGSQAKAEAEFRRRHPALLERIDMGQHRRIPRRGPDAENQLSLW